MKWQSMGSHAPAACGHGAKTASLCPRALPSGFKQFLAQPRLEAMTRTSGIKALATRWRRSRSPSDPKGRL